VDTKSVLRKLCPVGGKNLTNDPGTINFSNDEVNVPNCEVISAEFLKYPVLKFVALVDCVHVIPKSIVEILGKLL
jgi:hypothetical protein